MPTLWQDPDGRTRVAPAVLPAPVGGTSAGVDLLMREGRQGADAVTAVVKSGASKRGGKAKSHDDLAAASRVLRLEADGIRALALGLGDSFVLAIDMLAQRAGR